MKRLSIITSLLLLLILPSLKAQEAGIQFVENKSWQEILNMAEKENKLIFLDCYTTWCGPCKAMAKDVFPLKQVGDFMNPKFINVKLDMEKGEGIALNKKYREFIPGFPTYLLITSKGQVVHQVAGYNDAEKFIAKIQDGLDQKSWIALSAKYDNGQRDLPFITLYLDVLENSHQQGKIRKVVTDIVPRITKDMISNDTLAYKMFRKYCNTAENPLLFTLLTSPGIYRKFKDREKDINEWGGRLYQQLVNTFVENSTKEGLFDLQKAQKVLDELQVLGIEGREHKISNMLMAQAVAKQDGERFLYLYNASNELGLLKYKGVVYSNWATHLAGKTNDKAKLKQYLACAEFSEKATIVGPQHYNNYAFILDKLGEKAQAKDYYKKGEQAKAEFNERFKGLLN